MKCNPKQKQTLKEGYLKFVIKNDNDCWGWKGCKPKNPGYGQFRYGMKKERAHRASWIIHFGEIPAGVFVLHKCDNRICSNPDHLYLGSNLDNIKDMIAKNRHPFLNKKGEDNHMSILKKEQVILIKEMFKKEKSVKKIANIFNVSIGAIGNIKYNITWKDLQ